jgi:hypothetical protein
MSALAPKADIRTWPSQVWRNSSGSLAMLTAMRDARDKRDPVPVICSGARPAAFINHRKEFLIGRPYSCPTQV